MLTLNDYQSRALQTAVYPDHFRTIYPVLGLAGEAGEVADLVKKAIRDDEGVFTPERLQKAKLELGDVFWYLAVASHDLGFTLEEIAQANIEKLQSRRLRNVLSGSGDNR